MDKDCRCRQSSKGSKSLRYRVNVAVSVKNVHTWEATVEGTGYNQDEILVLSDALATELENRYGQREIF